MNLMRDLLTFSFKSGFRRNECKPLLCAGRQIGLVRDWVEKELIEYNDVFKISNDCIEINPELNDYDSRSQVRQYLISGHLYFPKVYSILNEIKSEI